MKGLIAILLCVSGIAAAQEQEATRSPEQELGSSWVELRSGGVVGGQNTPLSIVLLLENKTDQPIWVRVEIRSPDPAQSCTVTRRLIGRSRQPYACLQREIIPDRDYPITVDTFSDEALGDRQESRSTKMHFRAQDVGALQQHLGAPKQAITLADIWYRTEESQLLIAYKEAGSLEITSERILFSYPGVKLEIPVSSIQRLVSKKRFAIFDSNEWVVIEYRQSGKELVAAFKPAAFKGRTTHEEIIRAIRTVLPSR